MIEQGGRARRQVAAEPNMPGLGDGVASPTEIVLQIDQLVIEGYPASQRWQIASAIESELGRLLTEGGLRPGLLGGGVIPAIETNAFKPRPTDRAESVGAQVAHAIYDAMSSAAVEGGGQ